MPSNTFWTAFSYICLANIVYVQFVVHHLVLGNDAATEVDQMGSLKEGEDMDSLRAPDPRTSISLPGYITEEFRRP
jgi:hypothetical protein